MKELTIFDDYGSIEIELINEFEKKMGVVFPDSYKKLLSKHNGLSPIENEFKFKPIDYVIDGPYFYREGQDTSSISFFGYGERPKPDPDIPLDWVYIPIGTKAISLPELIQESQFGEAEYGHKWVIAFGCDGGGDHICFDYRHDPKTNEPKIVLMLHDLAEPDENDNPKMVIIPIADSFEEFIDMLYKPKDED